MTKRSYIRCEGVKEEALLLSQSYNVKIHQMTSDIKTYINLNNSKASQVHVVSLVIQIRIHHDQRLILFLIILYIEYIINIINLQKLTD